MPEGRVRFVRVVDSERRTARVYRAEGGEWLPGPDDVLEGEDVPPDFRCPLSDLL